MRRVFLTILVVLLVSPFFCDEFTRIAHFTHDMTILLYISIVHAV